MLAVFKIETMKFFALTFFALSFALSPAKALTQISVLTIFPDVSCGAVDPSYLLFSPSSACDANNCKTVTTGSFQTKCGALTSAEAYLAANYPKVGYLLTVGYSDVTTCTDPTSYGIALIGNGACASIGAVSLASTGQTVTFNADGGVSISTYNSSTCTGTASTKTLKATDLNTCVAGFKILKVGAGERNAVGLVLLFAVLMLSL